MRSWLLFIATCSVGANASNIRSVTVSETDTPLVRTAPGLTTMLEFESKPTAAVVGDQDTFKVEYVGNAIAVKPVNARSKTNLFVFADSHQFTFTLQTTAKKDADYVVRVKAKRRDRPVPRSASSGDFRLAVKKVVEPLSHTSLIIYLTVTYKKRQGPRQLKTPKFTARQRDRIIPIAGVYFDESSLIVVLRQKDLLAHEPLVLSLTDGSRSASLTIESL